MKWAAAFIVVVTLAACSDSNTALSSHSRAYAACRDAVFKSEDGLTPQSRKHVTFPTLDSDDVRFRRIQGDSSHLTVEARDVLVRSDGRTVHLYMSCDARHSARRWTAGASVTDAGKIVWPD